MQRGLVGSEMCIRDRYQRRVHGIQKMRRTKERFDTSHPADRKGISGLTAFDGEDLKSSERERMQKMQQNDWIKQQKEEKEEKKRLMKEEERMFAKQAQDLNLFRAKVEDHTREKQRDMLRAMKEQNEQLAMQKKERELQKKIEDLEAEYEEISYSMNTYGDNPIPPTFVEYAASKGITLPTKKLQPI
eukprot:TRINITY_DN4322_c0_g2_i8.p1 TRINITY_DN4322_c0_g2~~TRINITY_DN4322_c0_g2_i8.p1  ORF type:complete len:188 (-),score=62.68 TRINITY_DN4322_c0_g2_i8:37-600(-)